jgi:alpha-amylase/alpha-mannosidase (GH57 family)
MNKYVCVHGHFYQPPRENPWLNEVEIQESAHPYHDWNERITDECYARNSASRIQNGQGRIVDIMNNYARMSFNFGPTLLEWMEKKAPDTYQAILDADKESLKRFSGHGSALAQAYNHMILPLANKRDQRTQVIWGIYDFRKRFGREPEGMWLGETAANTDTLEVMAEHGIQFTILSPYQAKHFRKIGDQEWHNAAGAKIDPRRPYRCNLPSGRAITLFFYDAPVSQAIAFEGLLESGERFAHRLTNSFDGHSKEAQLMHIATDGETYGHHHRFGEMALSYALHHIEQEQLATITVYGEYLELHPPKYEAEIIDNTSWSCAHGVERWRSDCGCHTGLHPDWKQAWRGPLRHAFDWVRDTLEPLYEREMKQLGADPWQTRDNYIQVIMDRSENNVLTFMRTHTGRELSKTEQVRFLKLLEMQYHAMLMYTSCGWFFEEVTGIETMQDIFYAARALQLAQELSGTDYEPAFLELLEKAKSNTRDYTDAAAAYRDVVKPTALDLLRVGAHYAVSSLFAEYSEESDLYCYKASSEYYELQEAGRQKLAIGKARIRSKITWEEVDITFGVLHIGDHQLFGGVREYVSPEAFAALHHELTTAFDKGNVTEVIMLLDKHFETHSYSFWHLFRDDQKKILDQVLERTMTSLEHDLQQVYDNNYPLMAAIKSIGMKLPRPLQISIDYLVNTRFLKELMAREVDVDEILRLLREVERMGVKLDLDALNYAAALHVEEKMRALEENPDDLTRMTYLIDLLTVLQGSELKSEYWQAQNIAFRLWQTVYRESKKYQQDSKAAIWCKKFEELYTSLNLIA